MTHAHDEDENEMLWASSPSQRTAYDTIGRRHVDLPAGYEFIMAPDERAPVLRCPNFPDCACGDDCHQLNLVEESPLARLVLNGLIIAVALIGAGLLFVGTR
jgi:hypothetical protein